MPLMLDVEDVALMEKWLDPSFREVENFKDILKPKIIMPIKVTKIGRPSNWDPIDDSFVIRVDA
ncbi:MAG: hypothetical protein CMQ41_05900 [Gammaproteobacteria bacterium]|nr:hypothetical protein [Gammaproteobacteria bacterium]